MKVYNWHLKDNTFYELNEISDKEAWKQKALDN